MKNKRAAASLVVLACLLVAGLSVLPLGGTLAKWTEAVRLTDASGTVDKYTIQSAAFDTEDESVDPAKRVMNLSGFTVTNESTTLTRTIQLVESQLSSRWEPYKTGITDPLVAARISYRLAPAGATCDAPGGTNLWNVKDPGRVPAPRYQAPADVTFELAPGATARVCVDVDLGPSATEAERRTLLGKFAGGGIKVNSSFTTKEKLSARDTTARSATSLLRVPFPKPAPDTTKTDDREVPGCIALEGTTFHGDLQVYWTWPGTTAPGVPGAIHHWEIWYRGAQDSEYVPLRKHITDANGNALSDGVIPAESRSVRIERGAIRSSTPFPSRTIRLFALVAVHQGDVEPKTFMMPQVWWLSWDGWASPHRHQCEDWSKESVQYPGQTW